MEGTMAIAIDKTRGYVIMWRSIMDTAIWTNPKLERVYHWIMYRANHAGAEIFPTTEKVTIKPGQFVTSYPHAERELKMSVGSINTYLKVLKAESIIEIKSTNKYTVITVQSWNELQNPERKIENRTKTERKQTETNNTPNTQNTSELTKKHVLNEQVRKDEYGDDTSILLPVHSGPQGEIAPPEYADKVFADDNWGKVSNQ